jgi:ribonuclease VapC
VIVDTSALLAILFDERGASELAQSIVAAREASISTASYIEAAAVIDRRGDPVASRRLDELIDTLRITLIPLDEHQARLARGAYRDFGRGSRHPARLNLGDVFAYGLAKATDRPLLFVGNDFVHTDLRPATPGPG